MRFGVNTLFLVPGDVGGTEIYLRETLRAMAGQLRDAPGDDRLLLFTSRDNDEVLRADLAPSGRADFVLLPLRSACRPCRIVAEQTLLPLAVRRHHADVLWSPGYTAPLWGLPCPQAVTIHDLQYRSHPEDMSRLELVVLDLLVRGACRRVQRVCTVSHFARAELLRHGLAPAERISVVHGGVNPVFAAAAGAGAELPTPGGESVPPGTPYLLCVAHSYPHKRLHQLVEAFALLEERLPHHLVLVGKARRGEARLQQALAALRHPERVRRHFGLAHEQLVSLFQGASLFVLPSVYEGFGLPVLEAQLAGVPVVVNRLASLPEVGGEEAVYAAAPSAKALAEAILSVLGWSEGQRRQRLEAGRRHAARFSWSATGTAMLALLRDLVLPAAGRPGVKEEEL